MIQGMTNKPKKMLLFLNRTASHDTRMMTNVCTKPVERKQVSTCRGLVRESCSPKGMFRRIVGRAVKPKPLRGRRVYHGQHPTTLIAMHQAYETIRGPKTLLHNALMSAGVSASPSRVSL